MKNCIVSLLTLFYLVSCRSDSYYQNKMDTSEVDYSIQLNLKPLISFAHANSYELYYTLNTPDDVLSESELSSINGTIVKIADSLFSGAINRGSITVIKETNYTNRLAKTEGISDSMNPFEDNNVYLVEFIFRNGKLFDRIIH